MARFVRTCRRGLRARSPGSAVLLLAVLLSVAARSWGLGLGEINLDSALNERLRAEIPLLDAQGLQAEEILVTLASGADFERLGVERFFYLTDLRFEVDVSRAGAAVIRVTSSKPITEPYLNFLVQVLWPQGRMLKEYTLLLDPPTFSQAVAPTVRQPEQAAPGDAGRGVVERMPEPTVAPAAATRVDVAPSAPSTSSPLDEGIVGNEYRMTDRTDTLWRIASRTRPTSAVSLQQTMLAIARLNPDAFINGNINRLKAGFTLRLPTEADALAVGSAEALEQVAAHDRNWRNAAGRDAASDVSPVAIAERPPVGSTPVTPATERAALDATGRMPEAGSAGAAAEGQLRIVAGTGDSAAGAAELEREREQLTVALEEQDRLNREVVDLAEQLGREKELAANQLAVRERQLEVKDEQIAQMQAELARLRATEQDAAGPAQNQDQNVAAAPDLVAEQAPELAWWQQSYVMAAGAGVLVLLLAGGLIAARRRRAADRAPDLTAAPITGARKPPVTGESAPRIAATASAPTTTVQPSTVQGTPVQPTPVQSTPVQGTTVQPTVPAVPSVGAGAAVIAGAALAIEPTVARAEAEAGPVAMARLDQVAPEAVDVIGEADIYMAYGRHAQAERLLQSALEEDAGRHDVRLKLLELAARTGDQAQFDQCITELAERCDDEALLQKATALALTFGESPAAGAADQSPEIGQPALGSSSLESLDLESLDLESLDLASLDLQSLDLDSPVAGEQPVSGDQSALGPEPLETLRGSDLQTDEALVYQLDPDDVQDDAGDETGPAEPGVLGGDLGLEFRLEDTDLEALDDAELAFEMDGPQASDDEDFDFADDDDSASTKLDLARAYSEMGDPDGAREILIEVLSEGSPDQQRAAQALLAQL